MKGRNANLIEIGLAVIVTVVIAGGALIHSAGQGNLAAVIVLSFIGTLTASAVGVLGSVLIIFANQAQDERAVKTQLAIMQASQLGFVEQSKTMIATAKAQGEQVKLAQRLSEVPSSEGDYLTIASGVIDAE